jgi:hypothetical protein
MWTKSDRLKRWPSLHEIRPGDIILIHFRPAFAEDVRAALTAMHDAGLTPALLEDYISPPRRA